MVEEIARVQAVIGRGQKLVGRDAVAAVGELDAAERGHDRVAAGYAHSHVVGVELHLPGQGEIEQIDRFEHAAENRAQQPDDAEQPPRRERDTDIETAPASQPVIPGIAGEDDVPQHAIGHVDIGAQGHALLREVPELVGEHGLEFPHVDSVDEPGPDQQILPRRQHEIEQRRIVKHGRVHIGAHVHAGRPRSGGFIADALDELEELRLLVPLQFEIQGPIRPLPLEQAFDEEDQQHAEGEQPAEGRPRWRETHRVPWVDRADAAPPTSQTRRRRRSAPDRAAEMRTGWPERPSPGADRQRSAW